jgi:hypothetical protein
MNIKLFVELYNLPEKDTVNRISFLFVALAFSISKFKKKHKNKITENRTLKCGFQQN